MSTNNRLSMKYAWMAIAAACLLGIAMVAVTRWAAHADNETLLTEVIRAASVNARSEAQVQAMESMMRPMIANYPVMVVVGTLITVLLLGTVFHFVFKMFDSGLTWSQVFAAVSFAVAAEAAARLIVSGFLVVARAPTVADLADGTYPNVSAAALLPPDVGAPVMAAGRTLDAMTLVFLVVLVGVIGEYGGSKVKERTFGIAVAVTFGVWLVIRIGWAAIFGR